MNYKAIIFDYDGTLCDTRESIFQSVVKTFTFFNQEIPGRKPSETVIGTGASLRDTFATLAPFLPEDQINSWVKTYRYFYKKEGNDDEVLFPYVKKLFKQLHEKEIPIIVLSNKGIEAVKSSLKCFGLTEYCDLIIGDGFMEAKYVLKPDASIFSDYILPLYPKLKQADFLMVGDTEKDLNFAKNCGIRSCWCAYGFGDNEQCMGLAPDFMVSDLRDL